MTHLRRMQYHENYGGGPKGHLSCVTEGRSCDGSKSCCSPLLCDKTTSETPTCRNPGACYWKSWNGNTHCAQSTEEQCNKKCGNSAGTCVGGGGYFDCSQFTTRQACTINTCTWSPTSTQWVKNTECMCPQDQTDGTSCEFMPADTCDKWPAPAPSSWNEKPKGACYFENSDDNNQLQCSPATHAQCYQRCAGSATGYQWEPGHCNSQLCPMNQHSSPWPCEVTRKCPGAAHTNECNPAKGCNVCAACCQSYLPDGPSCDQCVQASCPPTPAPAPGPGNAMYNIGGTGT